MFYMRKSFLLISFVIVVLAPGVSASGPCEGRFPNPVSDICWLCIFPINIGGVPINISGQSDNSDSSPPLLCTCPAPPPVFIRLGIGISFWEPARVAEVVRTPMCSTTLNGTRLGSAPAPSGTNYGISEGSGNAFYHVHWLQYPVLNWLGMAITQGACYINESFDMAYLSEFDPLWDDDELAFLMNPEAVLFASPAAQAACVADSVRATASGFGYDEMFWCSGSQGSLYPLSGTHANHVGGVDSSLALTHTMVFKLHRQFLAMDTSTTSAMCGSRPQPILRKTQYKYQMLYPIPYTRRAYGFGAASTVWGSGREYPYKGEDFSYMMWRKRKCCAF